MGALVRVESGLPATLEAEVSAAVALVESSWRPANTWRGLSGEFVSGGQVVEHLAATFALLERVGWVRTWRDDDGPAGPSPVDGLSGSSSLREVLRAAVSVLKEFAGCGSESPLEFGAALHRVGDTDSWCVTDKVLSAVLRARSGAVCADVASWASRRGRTFDEIRQLAAVAAEVARRIGPEAGGR